MILSVNSVTKYFGRDCVLDDVSFNIETPCIVGLVAPNGSGKTTLFNIIANLESYESGKIEIFGKSNTSPNVYQSLSYQQDNSVLFQNLTCYEHLKFIADFHKKAKSDILKIIEKLNMTKYKDKKVKFYSLGMKQHLLLAMSLLSNPKLLLLDEPINGLDPNSTRLFREIISDLKMSGTTVILSSHNLDELNKIVDKVLFLFQGRIINSEELNIKGVYVFIVENVCEKTLNFPNFSFEIKNQHEIHLDATESEFFVFEENLKQAGITILNIHRFNTNLEKAYFDLYFSKES